MLFQGGFRRNAELYIRTAGFRRVFKTIPARWRSQAVRIHGGNLKALIRYWRSIGISAWFKYTRLTYVFWFFCKNFRSKNSISSWIHSKKYKSNQSIVTKGPQLKILEFKPT